MKKFLLLAGAVAMLGVTPALADKPANKGQGSKAHATKHAGHKAVSKGKHGHAVRDRNRNGLDDRDEALARKYGGALCPPGLAKKTPACQPPGQAKREFREGQRLSSNYRYYTPYGDIPTVLRDRYDLDDDYRYIYRNNVIYTVDPRTSLVTSIINAIL
jgi:Ni/Co efflux regulator RcnB